MIRITDGRDGGRRRLLNENAFASEVESLRRAGERGVGDLVVDRLDEHGRLCWRAFCTSFEELEALARDTAGLVSRHPAR